MNAYNNGIEGQDVRNCDFSALSQDQFEMLRFDEDTNFEGAKFKEGVNPEEILKRGNTQIQSQTNNGDMLHVAIIDTPIAESGDNQNLIVENEKLRTEVRKLKASLDIAGSNKGVTNVDLLKRISDLEKVVYGE